MKKKIVLIFTSLLVANSSAWASEPIKAQENSNPILGNIEASQLPQAEMASTFGKHLKITNGSNEWEHPVSAFHGTLTITPRGGASLVIDEWLVR